MLKSILAEGEFKAVHLIAKATLTLQCVQLMLSLSFSLLQPLDVALISNIPNRSSLSSLTVPLSLCISGSQNLELLVGKK